VQSIQDTRRANLRLIVAERYPRAAVRLAEQLEFSTPGLLYRLLSGSKPIGTALARRIELTAGYPENWLDTPRAAEAHPPFGGSPTGLSAEPNPGQNLRPQDDSDRRTPVVSWSSVAALANDPAMDAATLAIDWMHSPIDPHDRLISLRVEGDSMSGPDDGYRDGDIVWLDMKAEPAHNDDVVVLLPSGTTVLRRLQVTHEGRFIKALNLGMREHLWPLPPDAVVAGVIIFAGRFRRSP
jgi:SOS-response transcriptional repressor LexA